MNKCIKNIIYILDKYIIMATDDITNIIEILDLYYFTQMKPYKNGITDFCYGKTIHYDQEVVGMISGDLGGAGKDIDGASIDSDVGECIINSSSNIGVCPPKVITEEYYTRDYIIEKALINKYRGATISSTVEVYERDEIGNAVDRLIGLGILVNNMSLIPIDGGDDLYAVNCYALKYYNIDAFSDDGDRLYASNSMGLLNSINLALNITEPKVTKDCVEYCYNLLITKKCTVDEFLFVVDIYLNYAGTWEKRCPVCCTIGTPMSDIFAIEADIVIDCSNPTTHFATGCHLLNSYDTSAGTLATGIIKNDNIRQADRDFRDGIIDRSEYLVLALCYQMYYNTSANGGVINAMSYGCSEVGGKNFLPNECTENSVECRSELDDDGVVKNNKYMCVHTQWSLVEADSSYCKNYCETNGETICRNTDRYICQGNQFIRIEADCEECSIGFKKWLSTQDSTDVNFDNISSRFSNITSNNIKDAIDELDDIIYTLTKNSGATIIFEDEDENGKQDDNEIDHFNGTLTLTKYKNLRTALLDLLEDVYDIDYNKEDDEDNDDEDSDDEDDEEGEGLVTITSDSYIETAYESYMREKEILTQKQLALINQQTELKNAAESEALRVSDSKMKVALGIGIVGTAIIMSTVLYKMTKK